MFPLATDPRLLWLLLAAFHHSLGRQLIGAIITAFFFWLPTTKKKWKRKEKKRKKNAVSAVDFLLFVCFFFHRSKNCGDERERVSFFLFVFFLGFVFSFLRRFWVNFFFPQTSRVFEILNCFVFFFFIATVRIEIVWFFVPFSSIFVRIYLQPSLVLKFGNCSSIFLIFFPIFLLLSFFYFSISIFSFLLQRWESKSTQVP